MTNSESSTSVVRASLWAMGAAILALVLVVLPAEYGIDLTGFGRLTGLNGFSQSKAGSGEGSAKSVASAEAGSVESAGADASGTAPALKVWSVKHAERYVQRTYEVPLKVDEELEYKAVMARGDALLYRWRVKEGGQVYFEFHGEPTEGKWPEGYYESYEKGEGSSAAGSMVAPFNGNHGWYWQNLGDKPVTIVVELAGYYHDFALQTPPQS